MNRIDKLFQSKQKDVLSIYFSAGHPNLHDTVTIIHELEKHGADMIEIGMPFSDPMADGPVIQQSNQKALENGMTLELLFEQLKNIRDEINIPLILMGYMNPVLQYGMEAFCKKCNETGIDGIILPDMPVDEYETLYKKHFTQNHLHCIFLISPQTSPERIKHLAQASSGFSYLVSSSSTTGAKDDFSPEQEDYFKRVHNMHTGLPLMVGFGISNNKTFNKVCKYAQGAIIGSAFIKALEEGDDLRQNIQRFVYKIRGKD
jgi:tryptophan synthase alpha chain